MSNLINFDFQSQTVRVELKNGEPLFCLTDVATILEITNANPSRFNLSNDGVHKMYSVDSKGRKNEITFINEPNLYRVIFRSNKPEAEKFQNWVFDEVLPSIRKTGSYSQKTNAQDRTPLIQACTKLSAGRMSISDVYKMVGNHFGYDDVQSIPMHQLAEATAFVYEMIIRLQPQQNQPDIDNQTETNEMWRMQGLMRHDMISVEIVKIRNECYELMQKLSRLQKITDLVYDAFGQLELGSTKEQKQNARQKAIDGHQRNLIMHCFQ